MEFQKSLFPFFALFSCFLCSSQGYRFYVGGREGWVVNPRESYNQWAGRNRFQVNDTLYFKYKKGSDSVLLVNKDDYYNCSTKDPLKKMEDGDSEFKFDRSGPFYFISGNTDQCKKGQKLIVVVLQVRPPLPSPETPFPPGAKPPSHAPPQLIPPPSQPPTVAPSPKSPSPTAATSPSTPPISGSNPPEYSSPSQSPSPPQTSTPASPPHNPNSPSVTPSPSPSPKGVQEPAPGTSTISPSPTTTTSTPPSATTPSRSPSGSGTPADVKSPGPQPQSPTKSSAVATSSRLMVVGISAGLGWLLSSFVGVI